MARKKIIRGGSVLLVIGMVFSFWVMDKPMLPGQSSSQVASGPCTVPVLALRDSITELRVKAEEGEFVSNGNYISDQFYTNTADSLEFEWYISDPNGVRADKGSYLTIRVFRDSNNTDDDVAHNIDSVKITKKSGAVAYADRVVKVELGTGLSSTYVQNLGYAARALGPTDGSVTKIGDQHSLLVLGFCGAISGQAPASSLSSSSHSSSLQGSGGGDGNSGLGNGACTNSVLPLNEVVRKVVVTEETGSITEYSFDIDDSKILTQGGTDFETGAHEQYDVFISDANGQLDIDGSYITIKAFRNTSYTDGGAGNNVDAVRIDRVNNTAMYADRLVKAELGSGLSPVYIENYGYAARALGPTNMESTKLGDGSSSLTVGFCGAVPAAEQSEELYCALCGDGIKDDSEECEVGFNCATGETCNFFNNCLCEPDTGSVCGNRRMEGSETCEFGFSCAVGVCNTNTCQCVAPNCEFGDPTCSIPCASNVDCNDGVACTNDACVENVCVNDNTTCGPQSCTTSAECSDGVTCSVEQCMNNICVSDQQYCAEETCETASDCNDGVSCTTETCENNVCVYNAESCTITSCETATDCGDGISCTTETCENNICVYNGSACTGVCNTAEDCSDGEECTNEFCAQNTCISASTDICEVETCNTDTDCTFGPECAMAQCMENICRYDFTNCNIECITAEDCDDGVECTDELCLSNECVYDLLMCDDSCETNEDCISGICDENRCVLAASSSSIRFSSSSSFQAQSSSSLMNVCGNGVLNVGEQCDDGNLLQGDGCDLECRIELILSFSSSSHLSSSSRSSVSSASSSISSSARYSLEEDTDISSFNDSGVINPADPLHGNIATFDRTKWKGSAPNLPENYAPQGNTGPAALLVIAAGAAAGAGWVRRRNKKND